MNKSQEPFTPRGEIMRLFFSQKILLDTSNRYGVMG